MPMVAVRSPGWLRRIFRGVVGILAAVWILIEEWLWDGLKRGMQWLGRLPIVRGAEARISRAGPKTAISLFLIPWLLLLPAKLLAFWLMGTGRAAAGLSVFVAAKLLGTALLARLFTLTRPALLTITWFRRLHDWFAAIKLRLFVYVRGLRVVIWVKALSARLRRALKRYWRQLHGAKAPPR
jgi:hypothetical protein